MYAATGQELDVTACALNLTVGYGRTEVLTGVNFELRPGVTALLGRNGGGKTTLMRTLCGIIPALDGSCEVLGSPVHEGAVVRSTIGHLGHESALASGITVSQNLSFWRGIVSSYPQVRLIAEAELIERFDLGSMLDRKVKTLSRGQQQRVDLARLAMTDPQFIVLDEPLTGLDPIYAARTRELLRTWGSSRTVLYSTHSVPEALEVATKHLVVQGKGLRILGEDTTAVDEQTILEALEATA